MMLFNFKCRTQAIGFVDSINDEKSAFADVVTCVEEFIQVRIKLLADATKQEIQYIVDTAEVFYSGDLEARG